MDQPLLCVVITLTHDHTQLISRHPHRHLLTNNLRYNQLSEVVYRNLAGIGDQTHHLIVRRRIGTHHVRNHISTCNSMQRALCPVLAWQHELVLHHGGYHLLHRADLALSRILPLEFRSCWRYLDTTVGKVCPQGIAHLRRPGIRPNHSDLIPEPVGESDKMVHRLNVHITVLGLHQIPHSEQRMTVITNNHARPPPNRHIVLTEVVDGD